jgi:DNA-binding cell septation regulator SpoVG
MKNTCQWFTGAHPQFNVSLASKEGVEPFLIVKGCRIVNGSNGEFVSWPATKNQSAGKYWNHVWASDAFAAAVLAEARATMPQQQPTRGVPVDDSELPF